MPFSTREMGKIGWFYGMLASVGFIKVEVSHLKQYLRVCKHLFDFEMDKYNLYLTVSICWFGSHFFGGDYSFAVRCSRHILDHTDKADREMIRWYKIRQCICVSCRENGLDLAA